MVRTGAYLPVASGTNGTNVRYDGRSGAQCGRPGRGLRTTGSGVWTRAAARWKKGLAMVLERPWSVDGQNRQFHKM
jgi:hypothetical protein